MVRVAFTPNIQRFVACSTLSVAGGTVKEVLDGAFLANEQARSYVLDEHGAIRRHMIVFINGQPVKDRQTLSDPVPEGAELFVCQALSGG